MDTVMEEAIEKLYIMAVYNKECMKTKLFFLLMIISAHKSFHTFILIQLSLIYLLSFRSSPATDSLDA